MELRFSGTVWYWRGPSPFHFVTVPDAESEDIHATASTVTYGWGMIPVTATVGGTVWTTSLFPKNGAYIVPLKLAVRSAESLEVGDSVTIDLLIDEDVFTK